MYGRFTTSAALSLLVVIAEMYRICFRHYWTSEHRRAFLSVRIEKHPM